MSIEFQQYFDNFMKTKLNEQQDYYLKNGFFKSNGSLMTYTADGETLLF